MKQRLKIIEKFIISNLLKLYFLKIDFFKFILLLIDSYPKIFKVDGEKRTIKAKSKKIA